MTQIQLPLNLKEFNRKSDEYKILANAEKNRATTATLMAEDRFLDALERTVSTMRELRDFPDIANREFRTIFSAILFDLAEIHFMLKDYNRSEKELETLFKVLTQLAKDDPERYGQFHILAMELAARIIRSRKKTIEMLMKQKQLTESLYEKVNSGVASATDRLAESLRKVGELMASSGSYKEALKFYSEAIKFSKMRSGGVGRKEIRMTIEMAEIMSRVKTMRERAKRLLAAVLPRAIALETVELEEDIVALMEMIDVLEHQPTRWKAFTQSMSRYMTKANELARRMEKKAAKAAGGVAESVAKAAGDLADTMAEVADKAEAAAETLATEAKDAAEKVGEVAENVAGKAKTAAEKTNDIADKIADKANDIAKKAAESSKK